MAPESRPERDGSHVPVVAAKTRHLDPEHLCRLSFTCGHVPRERKWLSGRASPCQGEGRGFESRLPLHLTSRRAGSHRRRKRRPGAGPIHKRPLPRPERPLRVCLPPRPSMVSVPSGYSRRVQPARLVCARSAVRASAHPVAPTTEPMASTIRSLYSGVRPGTNDWWNSSLTA